MKLYQAILLAILFGLISLSLIILGILGFMLCFSSKAFINDEPLFSFTFNGSILLIALGGYGSVYVPSLIHSYFKERKKKEQAILFGLISLSLIILGFILMFSEPMYMDEVRFSVAIALIGIGLGVGITSIVIGLGGSIDIPIPSILKLKEK